MLNNMKPNPRNFDKKEFADWFRKLEEEDAIEYKIGNLKRSDFEQYYKDGYTRVDSIEKFLYD